MNLDEFVRAAKANWDIDLTDELHRHYQANAPFDWCDIATLSESIAEKCGIAVDYGGPVHALLNATAAQAFHGGLIHALKLLGVPELHEVAMRDSRSTIQDRLEEIGKSLPTGWASTSETPDVS